MTTIGEILMDDIRRQREIAERALAKAKVFDEAIRGGNPDPLLIEAKNVLLSVARDLAANATIMSFSASNVIRSPA